MRAVLGRQLGQAGIHYSIFRLFLPLPLARFVDLAPPSTYSIDRLGAFGFRTGGVISAFSGSRTLAKEKPG